LHLRTLAVANFRNLAAQELVFPSRITVIAGRNAQGKTSLLEAIFLLGHARSFRTARLEEVQAWESVSDVIVEGEAETSAGALRARYEISGGKRRVFLNEKRVASAAHFYGRVKIVEFTPDDLFLVKGAPAERRRYLDRLLALKSPTFIEHSVLYHRALRNRNALLASGAGTKELESWTPTLIEHGRAISSARAELASFLAERMNQAYRELLDAESSEAVSASYRGDYACESMSLRTIEDLATEYEARWGRDRLRRATTFGPHHDDLTLTLSNGGAIYSARQVASQGQARCFALALKLLGIEFLRNSGEDSPIVILDDVESELDQGRRMALMEKILSLDSQVVLATTDAEVLPRKAQSSARFLSISGGKISSL
jgi:DNA replication and repair protein RecF